MLSMTGFGKARARGGDGWLVAEVSSVNRKQLEILVNLPRGWSEFENEVRQEVLPVVTRGRVQVTVFVLAAATGSAPRVDYAAARAWRQALERLRRDLHLEGRATLSELLALPGVIQHDQQAPASDLIPALKTVTKRALADWQRMRAREGGELARDIARRVAAMNRARARIAKLAPAVIEAYRRNLRARLEKSGFRLAADDENLRRELFHFADRSDISEELTRLASHLGEFARLLRGGGQHGRKLEFLLQEIQREVHTTGSKAGGLEISREVVEMKTEIEKVREQLQNLE